MKILLPLYSSTDAKLILDFVGDFNWPSYACFNIIHVEESGQPGQKPNDCYSASDKKTISLFTYARYRLKTLMPEVIADYELVCGTAAAKIVETAEIWQADMIVMAARTGQDNDWADTGSIARAVLSKAPCTVVTVRPPQRHNTNAINLNRISAANFALSL
jgi:nucleotide-binding universal stress UspA family protein